MEPQKLLKDVFGFSEFRPGQEEAIQSLLAGRNSLAVFPTGGGKSICYQLPALEFEGVTLVVSPLIALMKDQIDFLRSKKIAAARLDSSLSLEESQSVIAGVQDGSLKLLYVSPERFNNERFLASMKCVRISLFAVDEAHCISEWGHNFRPDYLKLADTAKELKVERVLALTATATPSVVEDICKAFAIAGEDSHVTGFYRGNLNLAITATKGSERNAMLLKRLKSRKPGSAIVYVTLHKTAENVAAFLKREGFEADAYHAGMASEDRSAVQEKWMASNQGIVVATIAFGMGIDKSDVRYVYHYNLPKSLESYSQEIGRAGRDGLKSTVELFACPEDAPTIQNFAYGDTPSEEALFNLLKEILANETEFALNLYELSNQFDLRMLVLKTTLTYLELAGVLRQGTPFYSGYEVFPKAPIEEIIEKFPGEHGKLVKGLFSFSKKGVSLGRTKYALNPDLLATILQQERRRVVRALEVMEERGLVELRASDVRQRFTKTMPDANPKEIAKELWAKFQHRESLEISRLKQVLDLVTHEGCLSNELIGYFGEKRATPCGHCVYCLTGKPQILPETDPLPPIDSEISRRQVDDLQREHHQALGQPRQVARFLCGLSSPATSRARLGKTSLFGRLEHHPFQEILEWASEEMME